MFFPGMILSQPNRAFSETGGAERWEGHSGDAIHKWFPSASYEKETKQTRSPLFGVGHTGMPGVKGQFQSWARDIKKRWAGTWGK